jgi:DNA-binding transcriptional LysR family regulator
VSRLDYDQLTGALRETYQAHHPVTSTLRLGATNAASVGPRLLEVIDAYEGAAGDRLVQIVELPFADMLGALRRGVDVMIARLPVDDPDFVVGPVMDQDPRVLAVASDHPLAARSAVSIEDIAGYDVGWGDGAMPKTGDADRAAAAAGYRSARIERIASGQRRSLIALRSRSRTSSIRSSSSSTSSCSACR